jgi:aminoglycoside 6'-N-acetyltransferase
VIDLRPASDGDRFLLARWLTDPHVTAWFGSRAAAEAVLAAARHAPSGMARIIAKDRTPIGYVQAVDAADLGSPYARSLPSGSMELDGFIGEANLRGQGLTAEAFARLRDEVFETTMSLAVAVLVPISRESAVRRLERGGFTWQEIVEDGARGRCWLMVSSRDQA